MIDKREILEAASTLSLLPNVVEKDYVLGWILGGINANSVLANSWVFKGGTCLKKCFFETYRFSEDLDFTLRDPSHIDQEFLQTQLTEVVKWVADQSGLNMPPDQISIDIYDNPRGKPSCQGKIGYRGPVSPSSGGWPKIKLDLSADEKIVLPSVRQPVFHPYSDAPPDGIWTNCYAYEEAFAEKVRALGERTRPRDLYDVVNLYRHLDARPSAGVLRDVLKQKCDFKSTVVPTFEALEHTGLTLKRSGQLCSGINCPSFPQQPISGMRYRRYFVGYTLARKRLREQSSSPACRKCPFTAGHCRCRFRYAHDQHLRRFVLQRLTIFASISSTKTRLGGLNPIRCGALPKAIMFYTLYEATRVNTARIDWIAYKGHQ